MQLLHYEVILHIGTSTSRRQNGFLSEPVSAPSPLTLGSRIRLQGEAPYASPGMRLILPSLTRLIYPQGMDLSQIPPYSL